MSFTDRIGSIIIADSAFLAGAWYPDIEDGGRTEENFDDLNIRWLRHSGTKQTIESVAADFALGYKLLDRNFWCVGASAPRCLAGSVWET